jgi:hypothetical protein
MSSLSHTPTLISLLGTVSSARAFRLPHIQLPTLSSFRRAAYTAFHIDAAVYELHLYFVRGGGEELSAREWDRGDYWVGGTVEVWAGFDRREEGGNVGRRSGATTVYALCTPFREVYYSDAWTFVPVPTRGQPVSSDDRLVSGGQFTD